MGVGPAHGHEVFPDSFSLLPDPGNMRTADHRTRPAYRLQSPLPSPYLYGLRRVRCEPTQSTHPCAAVETAHAPQSPTHHLIDRAPICDPPAGTLARITQL